MYTIGRLSQELLSDGEVISYIELPSKSSVDLDIELKSADHLKPIYDISLAKAKGVSILGKNWADVYTACIYVIKKFEQENDHPVYDISTNDDEKSPRSLSRLFNKRVFSGEKLNLLVVAKYEEIEKAYKLKNNHESNIRSLRFLELEDPTMKPPTWTQSNYPIVVTYNNPTTIITDFFQQSDRFFIFANVHSPRKLDERPFQFNEIFDFELGLEILDLPEPSDGYYSQIISALLHKHSLTLTGCNTSDLILTLKKFRTSRFRGLKDIEIMVNRLEKISYPDKIISTDLLSKYFSSDNPRKKSNIRNQDKRLSLNDIVGLQEEKKQLINLVNKFRYNQLRKMAGYHQPDDHLALVLMGSPGTAKTTLARILAELLEDAEVLKSPTFFEVNRSQIIGKYVGHTAPLVRDLFTAAKGGVIYIDEAYSLNDPSGFGNEALAQLVIEMEENPDTLVIFSGYRTPMLNWITSVNEGFRSRLTHIINIDDYSICDLVEIFHFQMSFLGYKSSESSEISKVIKDFLLRMDSRIGLNQLGNGRFMRKLLKASINYKVERDPTEYESLCCDDVLRAISEIESTEYLITDVKQLNARRIGFYL